jgi:tetratricopeptide (TPR) repeat protein
VSNSTSDPVSRHPAPRTPAVTKAALAVLVAATTLLCVAYVRERLAGRAAADRVREIAAERDEAARQRDEAGRQRDRAAAHFRLARQAVDRLHERAGDSPELKAPASGPLRARLLQPAVAFYEQIAREEGNDREVRLERGRADRRLGQLYDEAGQSEKAAAAFKEATSVHRGLVRELRGEPTHLYELARTYLDHARAYQTGGSRYQWQSEPAVEAARLAPGYLRQLVRLDPGKPHYRYDLAQALHTLGEIDGPQDGSCEEALALALGLTRDYPQDVAYQKLLAAAYDQFAYARVKSGRYAEAAAADEKGTSLVRQFAGRLPDDPGDLTLLCELMANLTVAYARSDRVVMALETAKECAALAREAADARPAVPEFQRLANRCLTRLAVLYEWATKEDLAASTRKEVVARQERLARKVPDDPEVRVDLARSRHALGVLSREAGREEEAQRHFQASEKEEEAAVRLAAADPVRHADLPRILRETATAFRKTDPGRADGTLARAKVLGSLESLLRAVESREKLAAEKPENAARLCEWGQSLYDLGQAYERTDPARSPAVFGRAEAALRKALAVQNEAMSADVYLAGGGRARARIRKALALVLLARGDRVAAVAEADAMVVADDSGEARYGAAGVLDRAATDAGRDTRLSEDERTEIAEHYGERAGILIEGVRARGIFYEPRKRDPAAPDDVPRPPPQRDDFMKLLGRRGSAAAAPPG